MPLCETNTYDVKEEIIQEANFRVIFEHGQWWIFVCNQIFAVIDTDRGVDFELI